MKPVADFRLASENDLQQVYDLNDRFNLKNIPADDHRYGFVTNTYSADELSRVINNKDMVIMSHDNVITGCLYTINVLPQAEILRTRWQKLVQDEQVPVEAMTGFGARIITAKQTRHFSYPVGLFRKFFELNADRYSCVFSGINKNNDVSLKALVKAYRAHIVDESPEYLYILFNKDHNIPLVSNN